MKETKLSDKEIREGAPFAALSYVLFLWIFAFIFKKDNRFAHYHAKQGVVISIGELIFGFAVLIFTPVPVLGTLIYAGGLIFFLAVSLYGMYHALTGKLATIRLVTEIAEKLII